MRNLPSFRSYAAYSTDNYGAHCLVFNIEGLSVYFSYRTPIAFERPATGLVIRENDWGPTTGKHLNWIDNDKSKRIPGDEFEKELTKCMSEHRKESTL